jgi:hypothetical protein
VLQLLLSPSVQLSVTLTSVPVLSMPVITLVTQLFESIITLQSVFSQINLTEISTMKLCICLFDSVLRHTDTV